MAKETEKPVRKAASEKKAAPNKPATAEKGRYIYVGASIPGSVKQNTIIEGEIPKELDRNYIRDLVIPVEEFGAFKKKKSVTGSFEAYCYRESAKYAASLIK